MMNINKTNKNKISYSLLRVINKFSNIDKKTRYYATDEQLFSLEIHMIKAIKENEGIYVTGLANKIGVTKGAAPYISRFLGEKNIKKASETSSTAFFSSLFWGLITILVILIFLDKILILFGATNTILLYARDYAIIFVAGSILNTINVTL